MGMYFVPQYFGKEYIHPLVAYRNPFAWLFFFTRGECTWLNSGIFFGKSGHVMYVSHGVILMSILVIILLFNKNFLNEDHPGLDFLGELVGITACYGFSEIVHKFPKSVEKILM